MSRSAPRFQSLSPFVWIAFSMARRLTGAGQPQAEQTAPAELAKQIEGLTLDQAAAHSVSQVKLEVGSGTLTLEQGLVFPAGPVGGKTRTFVFTGKGRIAAVVAKAVNPVRPALIVQKSPSPIPLQIAPVLKAAADVDSHEEGTP